MIQISYETFMLLYSLGDEEANDLYDLIWGTEQASWSYRKVPSKWVINSHQGELALEYV